MHQFDFGWGSAPDPAGGAYSAPRSPSCIWGLLLREGDGRVERGGEVRGQEGRGEEGARKAFPLFLFYETTTGTSRLYLICSGHHILHVGLDGVHN